MLHPTWNGADHVALREDGKTDSQLFDNFVFSRKDRLIQMINPSVY